MRGLIMLQKILNKLNDLRPKQLMVLAGLAAFLMFVAIYAGVSMLTSKEVAVNPEAPPPPKAITTKSVVVAKVNIPARTRIKDNMLQIKELPVEMVPEGAITSFSDVKDVQIKVSIFAGDVLTIQKVFADKGDGGFIGSIPPDCRAVSIRVNEITSVAGFAKPGDRVDLILSEKGNYSATTDILLQNVPLLSVNQDMNGTGPVDENGVPISAAIVNPSIATFALPPEDVLKLISASKLGEIYMMLRPSNPKATYVAEMEYTIDSVNKPEPEPEPVAPTPVIPSTPVPDVPLPQIPAATTVPMAPVTPKIDIIQGDELTQSSAETAQVQNFSAPSNSALPAIPSRGVSPVVSAPPVSDTPASNAPIMNQIGH